MLYLQLHNSKDLRSFNKIIIPGLQCFVFHENNCQCHHSSLQIRKENYSRGDHGHTQTSSGEGACADSSGHFLTLREMGMNEKITKVRLELFSIKAQG